MICFVLRSIAEAFAESSFETKAVFPSGLTATC
jgi:hypothetical protein